MLQDLSDQFWYVVAICRCHKIGAEEEGVLSRSRQLRRMRHPSSSSCHPRPRCPLSRCSWCRLRQFKPKTSQISTTHRWYLWYLCYYSSMISMVPFSSSLFTVTIHRSSDHPQISTTHPSCCPVHLRPARPIFQSYELWWLWFFPSSRELPIWSPILGFSKLSTLNFWDSFEPGFQTQIPIILVSKFLSDYSLSNHVIP
jgi:hypothetical protein